MFNSYSCTNEEEKNTLKVSASSIEQSNKQTTEQKKDEENLYYFDLSTGGVQTTDHSIMIFGKTNLFKGTVLELSFGSPKLKPQKVKVDEDGRFSITLDQTIKTDTEMRVVMKLDNQPLNLQEKYGLDGKKLFKSFQYKYKSNGN